METIVIRPKFIVRRGGKYSLNFYAKGASYHMSGDEIYQAKKKGANITLDLSPTTGIHSDKAIDHKAVMLKYLKQLQRYEPNNHIDLRRVIRSGGFINYIKELENNDK